MLCEQGPSISEVKRQNKAKREMATRYGVQFEDLMAEVCRDFGARLVKSFVSDAVDAFFKKKSVVEKDITSPVKPKAKKASKKKAEPEAEPEVVSDNEAEITVESPKKKANAKAPAKAKAKAKGGSAKPKCQATTAKGAPCSKCALDGEVFCSVHLKKVDEKAKAKAPAKAKTPAKAKGKSKVSPPKHTHSLTSPPLKEACDLCETHGMPFEVPEYEEETKSVVSENEKDDDPDFKLTEEDFDESDIDEDEFEELD